MHILFLKYRENAHCFALKYAIAVLTCMHMFVISYTVQLSIITGVVCAENIYSAKFHILNICTAISFIF